MGPGRSPEGYGVSVITVQYRVALSKKEERVDGPDDATVVVTVPIDEITADGFDPTVSYMRGRLKSTGSTAGLFTLLKSGAVADALARLGHDSAAWTSGAPRSCHRIVPIRGS